MADIKLSRNHSLNESELRQQLEKLAGQMAEKFTIRSDFQGNDVYLSGSGVKKGLVSWTANTLSIELTFGLMGKMFKEPIRKEIEKKMNEIVGA